MNNNVFDFKRPGAMNKVAQRLGYASTTSVPDSALSEFSEALANAYGEKSARGMIQAQVTLRKRSNDTTALKFRRLSGEFARIYNDSGESMKFTDTPRVLPGLKSKGHRTKLVKRRARR